MVHHKRGYVKQLIHTQIGRNTLKGMGCHQGILPVLSLKGLCDLGKSTVCQKLLQKLLVQCGIAAETP